MRDDAPPLGSWRRAYALVLAWLLVCILAFDLVGRWLG